MNNKPVKIDKGTFKDLDYKVEVDLSNTIPKPVCEECGHEIHFCGGCHNMYCSEFYEPLDICWEVFARLLKKEREIAPHNTK